MTDFNGGGFEVVERVSGPSKSLAPGIHVAAITNVEYGTTKTGTPYIKFTHMTKPVDGLLDEDKKPMGQKATTTMWMSPGAWNIEGAMWCTKARLTVISQKLGLEKEFNAIKGKDAEDFVNQVAKLFKGKKARWVFSGEEDSFTNDKGELINFVRAGLNSFGFVESLEEVPNDEDTKLYFNPDKHIKKAEKADSVSDDTLDADSSVDDEPEW